MSLLSSVEMTVNYHEVTFSIFVEVKVLCVVDKVKATKHKDFHCAVSKRYFLSRSFKYFYSYANTE